MPSAKEGQSKERQLGVSEARDLAKERGRRNQDMEQVLHTHDAVEDRFQKTTEKVQHTRGRIEKLQFALHNLASSTKEAERASGKSFFDGKTLQENVNKALSDLSRLQYVLQDGRSNLMHARAQLLDLQLQIEPFNEVREEVVSVLEKGISDLEQTIREKAGDLPEQLRGVQDELDQHYTTLQEQMSGITEQFAELFPDTVAIDPGAQNGEFLITEPEIQTRKEQIGIRMGRDRANVREKQRGLEKSESSLGRQKEIRIGEERKFYSREQIFKGVAAKEVQDAMGAIQQEWELHDRQRPFILKRLFRGENDWQQRGKYLEGQMEGLQRQLKKVQSWQREEKDLHPRDVAYQDGIKEEIAAIQVFVQNCEGLIKKMDEAHSLDQAYRELRERRDLLENRLESSVGYDKNKMQDLQSALELARKPDIDHPSLSGLLHKLEN
ncbi:hypothetical protein HN358_04240 [Candidatus Uhrbacteria bacterium]|jgi:hypothetical protein|nr:hypothetical protein [Candidatus Uhrbacteria bacterium]MBT7716993.1 hypothetical protein [Candidatus Uhrbacteria bacterium]